MTDIRCEHISVRLADTSALEDVSFSLASGSRMAILGPSGAGKTTLLRVIAGLQKPVSGKVYFDGADVTDTVPFQRGAAVIFQSDALFPHTKIRDNIGYGLHKLGYDRVHIRQMVENTAELLHIEHLLDRYPASLSGGERQRAGMARALVRRPRILLLDEPFASLDTRLKEELQEEILRIQKEENLTMIEVTHDQKEAAYMGEKILLLDHGMVQSYTDPVSMRMDPDNLFTASFFSDPKNNILSGYVHDGKLYVCGLCFDLVNTPDMTLHVSLRPECIKQSQTGIEAIVSSVRPLQNAYLTECIAIHAGSARITALLDTKLKEGSAVCLTFDREDLRLFDVRGGHSVQIQFLR